MHRSNATLVAFCDGQGTPAGNRRVAAHLASCDQCRQRLRQIQTEKDEIAASAAAPLPDDGAGLAGILSAIQAWRQGRGGPAAAQLRTRLHDQIETFFGAPTLSAIERPGVRPEELLARTTTLLEVFLGPDAAEALRDDVLRDLHWAAPAGELS
jgi:anti-sigma factor RsiW